MIRSGFMQMDAAEVSSTSAMTRAMCAAGVACSRSLRRGAAQVGMAGTRLWATSSVCPDGPRRALAVFVSGPLRDLPRRGSPLRGEIIEVVDDHGQDRAGAGHHLGASRRAHTDEQIALVRRMRAEGVGWRRIRPCGQRGARGIPRSPTPRGRESERSPTRMSRVSRRRSVSRDHSGRDHRRER